MNKRSAIELILGILLIICSVFTFTKPTATFTVLGYIIGSAAILKGIHFIYLYFKNRDFMAFKANTFLVLGILLSIIGFIFILKPIFANNVFAYILAIWFIYDSVNNFFSINLLKRINFGLYILGILANVLLLIGGICIIINPWVASISLAIVLGVTFLVSGIEYTIFAITGRKYSNKSTNFTSRNLK